MQSLTAASLLPDDKTAGALVGRAWLPSASGPAVVAVRDGGIYDITANYPTVSALAEQADPAAALRDASGTRIDDLDAIAANTPPETRDPPPAMAAGADRPAGHQGRRRYLRGCRCWSG